MTHRLHIPGAGRRTILCGRLTRRRRGHHQAAPQATDRAADRARSSSFVRSSLLRFAVRTQAPSLRSFRTAARGGRSTPRPSRRGVAHRDGSSLSGHPAVGSPSCRGPRRGGGRAVGRARGVGPARGDQAYRPAAMPAGWRDGGVGGGVGRRGLVVHNHNDFALVCLLGLLGLRVSRPLAPTSPTSAKNTATVYFGSAAKATRSCLSRYHPRWRVLWTEPPATEALARYC